MKLNKNQLLISLLATGFLIGIIYTSIVKPEVKIFNMEVLEYVKNFKIVYANKAVVEHSHNYDKQSIIRRFTGEGVADKKICKDKFTLLNLSYNKTLHL